MSYLTSYALRNPRVRGAGIDEKFDTLLGALQRFRAALDAEAELYAHRHQHRRS